MSLPQSVAEILVLLRGHALRMGVVLPPEDLLDHDLVFVNFRLMVLKWGGKYEGGERDTTARRVARAAQARDVVARQAVALSWLSALAAARAACSRAA